MSILRLRKVFSKSIVIHLGRRKLNLGKPLVIILAILSGLFILALIPGGAPRVRQQATKGPDGNVREVTPLIAQVDGFNIERQDFEIRFLTMLKRQPGGMPISNQAFGKSQLLDSVIEQHLLLKAAKAEGIQVSRADLDTRINELTDQSISRSFPDRKMLRKHLKKKGLSYEQYREQVHKALGTDTDALREALLIERLKNNITGQVTVTDETVKQQYEEAKARHILIKPASPTTNKPPANAADSGETPQANDSGREPTPEPSAEAARDQARQQAEQLLAQIKKGADFAQLAREHSDDPGSGAKGGELGWFGRRTMVKEFADTAFALQPGQVSDVVESPFGFHIIKVEDKRINLPEDFEENKQRYIDQQKIQLQGQAWDDYKRNLKDQATIEVHDPELKAMALIMQGQQKAAIPLLEEAVAKDSYNLTARYTLAEIYKQEGNTANAIKYFRQLAEDAQAASSPEVHLELAKLLRKQGNDEEALNELDSASDWATAPQYQNYSPHIQLRQI